MIALYVLQGFSLTSKRLHWLILPVLPATHLYSHSHPSGSQLVFTGMFDNESIVRRGTLLSQFRLHMSQKWIF